MIFDAQTLFCDKMSVADATPYAAIVGTNIIDLNGGITTVPGTSPVGVNGTIGGLIHDIGRGGEVLCYVQVTTAIAAAATATIKFELFMNDTADGVTPTVIGTTGLLDAAAGIPAGTVLKITGKIPPGVTARYLGIQSTTATADTTAGAITAGLVLDYQDVHV